MEWKSSAKVFTPYQIPMFEWEIFSPGPRLKASNIVMMVTAVSIQGFRETGLYLRKIFRPQRGGCAADKTSEKENGYNH
jgi:hypothetical protein